MIEYFLKSAEYFGRPACAAILFYVLWLGPRSGWALSFRRLKNAGTNIIMVMANVSIKSAVLMGLGALSFTGVSAANLPHIPAEFWATMFPGAAFVTALIILDFANYWAHRILHTPLLWGIHAIHHADDDISWTTAYRIHFLESFVMGASFVLFVGWFGLPIETLGAAGAVRVWYTYYTHTQSGFDHGWLKKCFVSPNYHRWHHANEAEAYDKNLSDMFPVWDLVFGTYYNPGKCEAELGLGNDVPKGVVLSLSYPFKYWAKMLHDYFSGRAEKSALRS